MKRFLTYLSFASLFVLLSGTTFAQPVGPGEGGFGGFGPGAADGSRLINKLNRALEAAGGVDLLLTTGQEEQIAILLEDMRANRPTPDPGNRSTGSNAYADAILNGQLDAIAADGGIADQMAAAMAERTAQRLIAQAEFQIDLLGILDGSQIDTLKAQYGEQGLLRLLNSHGRGWMGRGGKMGGGAEGFSRERMRNSSRGEVAGP